MRTYAALLSLLLLGAAMLAIRTLTAGQESPAPADRLTPAERELAARLAWQAVEERGLRVGDRIYVVAAEPLRSKAAELAGETAREALVTHYRYAGDLAVLTRVDLLRAEVLGVEMVPHPAVPLAPEEFQEARRLALADARVTGALKGSEEVRVEALVLRAAEPGDPLFSHRVVRLLFRTERGYVRDPVVMVDLTDRVLLLEAAAPAP